MSVLTPEQLEKRKKTNKRILLGTALLLLVIFAIGITGKKEKPQPLQTSSIATLDYRLDDIRDTSTPRRVRAQVSIYLDDPGAQGGPELFAATCMAAAKHYAEAKNLQALSVFLATIPGDYGTGPIRLAECSYSPDKGGWSGDQNWQWENVRAVPRGLNEQEQQMQSIYMELRGEKSPASSAEVQALFNDVARRMEITEDEFLQLQYGLSCEEVNTAALDAVPAKGPVK